MTSIKAVLFSLICFYLHFLSPFWKSTSQYLPACQQISINQSGSSTESPSQSEAVLHTTKPADLLAARRSPPVCAACWCWKHSSSLMMMLEKRAARGLVGEERDQAMRMKSSGQNLPWPSCIADQLPLCWTLPIHPSMLGDIRYQIADNTFLAYYSYGPVQDNSSVKLLVLIRNGCWE